MHRSEALHDGWRGISELSHPAAQVVGTGRDRFQSSWRLLVEVRFKSDQRPTSRAFGPDASRPQDLGLWAQGSGSRTVDHGLTGRPSTTTAVDRWRRMIVVWGLVVVVGLGVSGIASGKALRAAESLGQLAGLSPFVIGLTIMSIGTDLPEIANSISASAAGRGDLNVGDSTGSAATQITFVLGLLLLMSPLATNRTFVAMTGSLTVLALLAGAGLMNDGELSRIDAAMLVIGWAIATWMISRTSKLDRTTQPSLFTPDVWRQVLRTLLALAAVGAGAASAVTAFGQITDDLGVPEYATSFFVLSIGTSLPELLVDGRAIRQGSGALALGDLLGSSLVDSTLSLGIGPLMFPTEVSGDAASGTLIVSGVVAAAIALLLTRTRHRWPSGIVLIGLYAALFPLLIAG